MAMIYCSGINANPAILDAARQLAINSDLDPETLENIQQRINRIAARRVMEGLLKDPANDSRTMPRHTPRRIGPGATNDA